MKRPLRLAATLFSLSIAISISFEASAQHAVQVTSYDSGTTPAIDFESGLPLNLKSSALGEPSRFTDDPFFPGVVSPFNAPYKRGQLLSVGESGYVTLRLSNYALAQPGGREIGVFAHAGLIDVAFPTGQASDPAAAFSVDTAFVEVSADGSTWFAIGDVTFDIPTNGYNDVSDPFAPSRGSLPSDFQKPFVGSLSSFDGLAHSPDVLNLLDGSGGGNWLDIPAGLSQVGFIRFSVADDGNPNFNTNFELDAVSVAHAASGAPTIPEPSSLLLLGIVLLGRTWRRRWPGSMLA